MSLRSRLAQLFRPLNRRPSRRPKSFQARRRIRPLLEQLEARVTPATFQEVWATLNLRFYENVTIVWEAPSCKLTVTGDSWEGTDSANVAGTTSATLTVTSAGLSAFHAVNLTDYHGPAVG